MNLRGWLLILYSSSQEKPLGSNKLSKIWSPHQKDVSKPYSHLLVDQSCLPPVTLGLTRFFTE